MQSFARSRAGRLLLGLCALLALAPGIGAVMEGRRIVLRGVNDAGGEWWDGRKADPSAAHDPYSSARTLRYLAARHLRLVRLPVRWERLQPVLGAPLLERELDYLRRYLAAAHDAGLQVIVEPHNGGRYVFLDGSGVERIARLGDAMLTNPLFCDFWRRMARALKDEPGLYGYGLMNEPANMPTVEWKAVSQQALDAIREVDRHHCIFIPGNNYASAQIWVMCHGREGWIHDVADNFAYEAHVYLDKRGDGTYEQTFERERAEDPDILDRGVQRLQVFVDWCHDNGVRGFVGEFGCPEEPGWLSVLDRTLSYMDNEHVDGTLWAVGERWPADYRLSLQPRNDLTEDRENMRVLLRHAGGGPTGSMVADFRQGYVRLWRRFVHWIRWLRG